MGWSGNDAGLSMEGRRQRPLKRNEKEKSKSKKNDQVRLEGIED